MPICNLSPFVGSVDCVFGCRECIAVVFFLCGNKTIEMCNPKNCGFEENKRNQKAVFFSDLFRICILGIPRIVLGNLAFCLHFIV